MKMVREGEFMPGSAEPRGAMLQPEHVGVVRRGVLIGDQPAFLKRRHGPIVAPALDFSMAVHERKSAGTMMVTAGEIVETRLRGIVRPAPHVGGKIAPVNAVLAHIHEQKNRGTANGAEVGHL